MPRHCRPLVVLTSVVLLLSGATPGGNSSRAVTPIYRDPTAPIDERVNDLLSRMTPEEKFWQLFMLAGEFQGDEARFADGLFGLQVPAEPDSAIIARMNEIQRHFVEDTRLGIPVVFFAEALHGLVQRDATVFPQAIGLAATFDTTLVGEVAGAIAEECRARGVRQVLSPVVNIAVDVRWGRVEETYGEDPFLSSRMGVAYVSPLERAGVITTPKHWIANVGDGGRDSYPVDIDQRLLREVHVPPFRACIERGGSRSIMTAYNSVDGLPCSANSWLNTVLLKAEMGFTGFVISDAAAVGGIKDLHMTAATYADAGKQAIDGGLDVIFQTSYDHHLLFGPAFRDGRIESTRTDDAVTRVLRAKFQLGLFEDPYVDTDESSGPDGSAHRALARRAAREAMVLLKNEGNVLPLSPDLGSIAVIGPDAAQARLGGYSAPSSRACSILDGIRERVGGATAVRYAAGCARQEQTDDAELQEAVDLASKCDAVVVAAGIEEGEFRDRASLALPGRQVELIRRVTALGRPVVVVLVAGSAVTMSGWLRDVPAVLEVWYPGEEGGRAVADVLFGDESPAGRLPITFPIAEGQLPLVYNHKPSGRGDDYLDLTGRPLFPFGHGLSYTTFEYSDLRIEPSVIGSGDSAAVRFTLTNTGSRDGDEVVQLYIHDDLASVVRPVMSLEGFERVHLRPGESREVGLSITPDNLSLLDRELREVVEPGSLRIMIGASSGDIRLQGELSVSQ
jgi:beta-glucosidase